MTFNHGVPGSNPGCLICIIRITCHEYHADVAELADALDLGSSGRPCRFDSCHPQYSFVRKNRLTSIFSVSMVKCLWNVHYLYFQR
jgi:hypothetical protein